MPHQKPHGKVCVTEVTQTCGESIAVDWTQVPLLVDSTTCFDDLPGQFFAFGHYSGSGYREGAGHRRRIIKS